MKKSELIQIIREAVRAEIKAALSEGFGEQPVKKIVKKKVAKKVQEQKAKSQQYTDNKLLNDVLNETANGESWPTIGNKTLSGKDALGGKAGLAAAMGLGNMDQAFGGKPTTAQMIPADRQHVEVPDDVGKALTRDYSDLMKAINKKKGK